VASFSLPGIPAGSGAEIGAGVPAPSSVQAPRSADAEAFGLHFSKHAARRIEQRGMSIDGMQMERLQRAVGQAEAKGSKDSLILLDELALVVSVQNRTVVTAVDEASRKEHVFTNIDSVVIAQ
jgi:flagellar operon protein